jgi:hypothetical protein
MFDQNAAYNLTDDQEEKAYDEAFDYDPFEGSELWLPENDLGEDPLITQERVQALTGLKKGIRPSQFTEFAVYMPTETGDYAPFEFKTRRHLKRIYDTPSRRVLLCCARQVEKSTMLGNLILCYSCLVPAFKTLYVTPSATQTKTFSNDRLKEPIETSPVLRQFTTNMLSSNILEKQFVNRSKVTLRYAYLSADRARGIPAWMLMLDELQDLLSDNISVIEQSLSHAPQQWKLYRYAGTPKSLDNIIEYYRANWSTQGEWVVPCDRHGGDTGRYWNILGEKNIGKKGLVCEKCKKSIVPYHPDAQWGWQVAWDEKRTPWESYRIPQLMVPWIDWTSDILLPYETYPRDRFYNEILGISYDSGLRPLTRPDIMACCVDDMLMKPKELENYRQLSYGQPIFAGIDWGYGERAYTVVTLAIYNQMKFRVFYVHRFTGEDADPEVQIEKLIELLNYFNVRMVGCDWGAGFGMNDRLIRKFGRNRVAVFQYMARAKRKVEWDPNLVRWKVHRTEVMSAVFTAIKRKKVEFPNWEVFKQPYAQDMLNIYSEYNKMLRMIQYDHNPENPDDTFHSFLYCLIGSMLIRPRPDIIAPQKENNQGVPMQTYTPGGTYQG